ncbi:type III-B CRISPR module-associated Cmr3 family protein [Peptococcaceae bacterium 1198_IL3148]
MTALNTKIWTFKALDTLFFRDATPYNAGEGGQSEINSIFPPFMNTLQGAIRVALAYGQGWTPEEKHKWPAELGTPDYLGQIKLQGPYLLRNGEMLFPAPLYLMYQQDTQHNLTQYTRLKPGDEVDTDMGIKRLPVQDKYLEGAKVMENYWLDRKGVTAVLNGKLPNGDNVFSKTDLYQEEHRVGIKREQHTRSAAKGMLYSCVHIRPQPNIALAVAVSGLPDEWHYQIPRLIKLGGEGRMVEINISDFCQLMPEPVPLKVVAGKITFTVTLITPGKYQDCTHEVIKNGPPGIPGKCVSACIGKLQRIGGWNSQNKCPLPLEPTIPAGSTWFYQADADKLESILAIQRQGVADPYGNGQIIIGNWEG